MYMKIWCNDNLYSDANANIPHINIKMLMMSGVHWWLILRVPETALIDNNLHCFKPIPTHCNLFAGNVSRMWLNIHSAWAQGCYKTMQLVFVTAITKKIIDIENGLPDGTKPLPSMLTVRSNDIHLRSISQKMLQPAITNISLKIAHLKIQFNLTGANELKINILQMKNYQRNLFS